MSVSQGRTLHNRIDLDHHLSTDLLFHRLASVHQGLKHVGEPIVTLYQTYLGHLTSLPSVELCFAVTLVLNDCDEICDDAISSTDQLELAQSGQSTQSGAQRATQSCSVFYEVSLCSLHRQKRLSDVCLFSLFVRMLRYAPILLQIRAASNASDDIQAVVAFSLFASSQRRKFAASWPFSSSRVFTPPLYVPLPTEK